MENEALILYRLEQQDKASSDFRDEVRGSLTRVVDLVTKTNGRVSKLEMWRYICTGGLLMLSFIIGWYVTLRSGK